MIYDIISKKRYGHSLSKEDIDYFIKGYIDGEIKDYQAAALLMAITINSMNEDELYNFTNSMINSGKVLDLSDIGGITVDKHSTGGVGDKTSLIIVPLVASLGVNIFKMSGKGLGHTGGTVDKLESIPNFNMKLKEEDMIAAVKKIGCCIVEQTQDIAKADKKLYALRDVTATVESNALIASSIMSKKIALGTDAIVLDVTVGNGAFMKDLKSARELADMMIKIAKRKGKKVVAIISDMNVPLGKNIGNILEVIEALEVLRGGGEKRLVDTCIELASNMVYLGSEYSLEEAKKLVEENLKNFKAYEKFLEMVEVQGGDVEYLKNLNIDDIKAKKVEIKAEKSGYVTDISAIDVAKVCLSVGAGRKYKDDSIDYNAGVVLNKVIGNKVKKGDILATIYHNVDVERDIEDKLKKAFIIKDSKPDELKLVYDRIEG